MSQPRMSSAEFVALLAGPAKSKVSKVHNARRVPDPEGGRAFDSKLEAQHAARLRIEQRAGLIVSFERQVRLKIEPEGVTFCTYVADFVATLPDGSKRIDECKGVWTDYALLKAKAFKLFWLPKHPDYSYRVLGGVRRQGRAKR